MERYSGDLVAAREWDMNRNIARFEIPIHNGYKLDHQFVDGEFLNVRFIKIENNENTNRSRSTY